MRESVNLHVHVCFSSEAILLSGRGDTFPAAAAFLMKTKNTRISF
jgi:hypothetical protein